jgi:NADH:ubiquinone oxidoreductase subunit 6 (subunit J)
MKKLFAIVLALSPSAAFAQTLGAVNNINDVSSKFISILNTVTVLLISLAVVWIIISVVRYLIIQGPEQRKEGGMRILWGIVGLFVILSIWGLVSILTNSFATNNTASQNIRNVQVLPGGVPPVQ